MSAVIQKAENKSTDRDLTHNWEYDTLLYGTATDLVNAKLFGKSEKDEMYRSRSLPLENDQYVEFKGCRVDLALVLAATSALAEQVYFERHSYLKIKRGDTEQPLIPLADLLPYSWVYEPGTGWVRRDKQNWEYFMFPDTIALGPNQRATFEFIPADGLATHATTTAATLKQAGLSGDAGHYIRFTFFGSIDRNTLG